MKHTIGISIMAIAAIHAIFGLAVFPGVWLEIARDGFFNVIGENPLRGAVVWFQLYALPVFAFGHLILSFERNGLPLPLHTFWHMTIILITGVILMPASGFWLLLIPLFFLWRRTHANGTRTKETVG